MVQSTQAGAKFGFTMIFAVVLANLFKYPFFEFGSRYANATGKSIISGYRDLGKWALVLYLLITIISMFLVTAAVGYVTSGFMQQLFGIDSTMLTVGIVFLVCIGLLISDNFKVLDSLIKVIGIVLLLSTLLAFVLVLAKGPAGKVPLMSFEHIDKVAFLGFLIPLMGWMPTAVDLSAWNSLWTVERIKQTGYHPKLKETLFDFNFGYITSSLLAICFLTLGTFVMFGTSAKFDPTPVGFSADVIRLYTSAIGPWSYYLIAIAAFSIMFGTCVAVFDGYSRAMSAVVRLMQDKEEQSKGEEKQVKTIYRIVLLVSSTGAFLLIYVHDGDPVGFGKLVNLATSVSFIIAPVIAILNLILVRKKYVGEAFAPPSWLKVLAWAGVIFLSVFTFFYIFQNQFIPN